jgi:hypothetical protein
MFEAVLLAALLSDGPAPDRGDALRDAARAGDVSAVTRLLDAGVPVDAKAPRHGQTPLLFAAGEGRLDVARLLVARGADVNARVTFFGQTPLSSALGGPRGGNHREVALFLLSKGAADAAEALDAAVQGGDLELARAALSETPAADTLLAAATLVDGALVVRARGADPAAVRGRLERLWSALRPRALGRPPCPPRIWLT